MEDTIKAFSPPFTAFLPRIWVWRMMVDRDIIQKMLYIVMGMRA